MPTTQKTIKSPKATTSTTFSTAEKAAMRERAREARANQDAAALEAECVTKIAEMPPSDRTLANQVHAIAKAAGLSPKTWYGMPAYAKDGKNVCWFQPASKFKSRYAFIGFTDNAKLDDGSMWPISFALTRVSAADEKRLTALVKQAAR
ncbi:MAG: hypothetical protein JOZ75_04700 [Candidatus Dormibacteraeota bacterium]|nr:hypothetical protein [Candidatus Dormibacteraeota bacterium]